MRIKIEANELKDILDKHFGGIDTHYDIEFVEDSYAVETRLGKEKVAKMVEAPHYSKVAIRAIFPRMSVLTAVHDMERGSL